jgi:thioredoxin 1
MKFINSVDEIIKNYANKILVLGFYPDSCQEYESLSKIFDDVHFAHASEELKEFFEVEDIQTFIILDNHKETLRVKGMNLDVLRRYFSKLTVLDFYATWCKPCLSVAPKFEELSKKFMNVSFKKVNVDDYPEISSEFKVNLLPTFVVLENDVEALRVTGTDLSKVEEFLNSRLKI